jgi:hypothetical protein
MIRNHPDLLFYWAIFLVQTTMTSRCYPKVPSTYPHSIYILREAISSFLSQLRTWIRWYTHPKCVYVCERLSGRCPIRRGDVYCLHFPSGSSSIDQNLRIVVRDSSNGNVKMGKRISDPFDLETDPLWKLIRCHNFLLPSNCDAIHLQKVLHNHVYWIFVLCLSHDRSLLHTIREKSSMNNFEEVWSHWKRSEQNTNQDISR